MNRTVVTLFIAGIAGAIIGGVINFTFTEFSSILTLMLLTLMLFGAFTGVLGGIVFVWLVEKARIKNSISQTFVILIAASITGAFVGAVVGGSLGFLFYDGLMFGDVFANMLILMPYGALAGVPVGIVFAWLFKKFALFRKFARVVEKPGKNNPDS